MIARCWECDGKVELIKDLNVALESAAETVKPVQRFTSDQEQAWLHRLVSKHGTDVEAMSRDRADNLWQKTAGEIRRA